jgi:Tol biopolymer transport system component
MKRLTLFVGMIFIMMTGFLSLPSPAGAVPPSYTGLNTDGQTIVHTFGYYYDVSVCWQLIHEGAGSAESDCVDGATGGVVSGDRVIWIMDDRLGGISLSTGKTLDLPRTSGVDAWPAIEGDRLVWFNKADPSEPWHVLTSDLSESVTPTLVTTLATTLSSVRKPMVSDDRIVWGVGFGEGANEEQRREFVWQLWTAKLGEDPVMLATETGSFLSGYDVGGDLVVYSTEGYVNLVDIRSPLESRLLSTTGSEPTTDGRYVFWGDEGYWDDESLWLMSDIHGYDARTDSYLRHSFNSHGLNYGPWTRGGMLVWWSVAPDTSFPYIESRAIQDILPSASQPDPGTTDPAWLYFDKTGHYLSYGFKDFWQNSGGLPVFGYPLTREYDELNRDLGEYRTVQYTERQRYEYHPAYAGTPYETLLGRLGAADADRRGLDDHPAFAPVDKPTSAGVEYFTATGHTLRGPFRDYWHRHGLEFGDAGVSYRESLALFGYPISEEFVDPDTGLTTQYFERAVFEYHPDNTDPYKVLLRRLGAEEMVRRGWRIEEQPEYARIAFTANLDGNLEIFTIRDDGSALANLTVNTAWDADPVWSPDGTRIAFTSDRSDSPNISIVNVDGTGVRNLTPDIRGFMPAWSPDGDRIAYIRWIGERYHIYVMDADGEEHYRVSGANNVFPHARPTWSEDSTQVAYVSEQIDPDRQLHPTTIHVVNVDGTGDTQIALDLGETTRPTWAPDGSRIAFVQRTLDSAGELYEALLVMNPDGSNVVQLTEPGPGERIYSVAWSPESNELAVHREPGGFGFHDSQIVIISEDEEDVIFTGDEPGPLSWAPDGLHIAFQQSQQIWVIDSVSGDLRALTDPDVIFVSGGDLAWAPKPTP